MPPLRPLPFRVIRRKLEAAGFTLLSRRGGGSHVKFVRVSAEGTRTVIVPQHREIAIGTLRSILSQAGLSIEELERL